MRRLAVLGVVVATGAVTVVFVSSGGRGTANAQTSLDQFVPIDRVAPNVVMPKDGPSAATGVFTVDCGTNRNGKFSPDNPVAQPGIKNGAEHLHDFVGNLAITADTSDEALAAAGTTCKSGDKSAYFWPVVRIDKTVRAGAPGNAGGGAPTASCPDVADRLPAIPSSVASQVRAELAALDRMTAEANVRLSLSSGKIDPDRNNAVLSGLRSQRAVTIKRISLLMASAGRKPGRLISAVDCDVSYDGLHASHTAAQIASNPVTSTVSCPNVKASLGIVPDQAVDEVDRGLAELDGQIAEANQRLAEAAASSGTGFLDNAILGPLRAKRTATIDRISVAVARNAAKPSGLDALAGCAINGTATPAPSPSASGAALPAPLGPDLELPNNTGGIVRPAAVLIEYRGNAISKVTLMPRFLRELTGDAKPTSRGPANARSTWTCSGFTDRLSDKYPICPAGQKVLRVQDFPGCWDGKNIDSTNHRTHVAFADRTGACPAGFVAIPQLRITIAYNIPTEVQKRGQYALDSFPEENHNPFSDRNDFLNVNSERQMRKIAACINAGRHCS